MSTLRRLELRLCIRGPRNITPTSHGRWRFAPAGHEGGGVWSRAEATLLALNMARRLQRAADMMGTGKVYQIWEYRDGRRYSEVDIPQLGDYPAGGAPEGHPDFVGPSREAPSC